MAVPLASEFAPAHAALIDADQTLIVELRQGEPEPVDWVREADDSEVERGTVSAKGKRAEIPLRCLQLRHRRLRATSELPDV